MAERETWTTRLGFILAAVGSAVGLGNIWRFPFLAADSGGGAFLVIYLIAIVVIGLPALLAEFVIGRKAQVDAIGAFRNLGHGTWRFIGAIGVLASFWTLSYYSVIGGWVIRYVFGSATGTAFGETGAYFTQISTGTDAILLHVVFMLITISIVALGIERGIEIATKLMVPSIVILLIGLAVYTFFQPGATEGYQFLFNPDVSVIVENYRTIIPAAVGQALFSLSVGFSVMITYASYLGKDDDLATDGVSIAITNTFVGLLAGAVVLPLLFVGGAMEAGSGGGPGAVFIAIPVALSEFGGLGQILGVIFFFVVLIAALSSAISLLEAPVAYVVDEFEIDRLVATLLIGGSSFALGILSALDQGWLTWFDSIGVSLFLPFSVLFVVVFVGWVMGEEAVTELQKGLANESLAGIWLWGLRTIVLVAVVVVLVLNLHDLFVTPEAGTYYLPPPFQN